MATTEGHRPSINHVDGPPIEGRSTFGVNCKITEDAKPFLTSKDSPGLTIEQRVESLIPWTEVRTISFSSCDPNDQTHQNIGDLKDAAQDISFQEVCWKWVLTKLDKEDASGPKAMEAYTTQLSMKMSFQLPFQFPGDVWMDITRSSEVVPLTDAKYTEFCNANKENPLKAEELNSPYRPVILPLTDAILTPSVPTQVANAPSELPLRSPPSPRRQRGRTSSRGRSLTTRAQIASRIGSSDAPQDGNAPSPEGGKESILKNALSPGSFSPGMVNLHGPKSDDKATLAFTLKRPDYPKSSEDPPGTLEAYFTFCRGKDCSLNTKERPEQTFTAFLATYGLRDKWNDELQAISKVEWASDAETRKLCIQGNGPARTELEVRLGKAFGKWISERLSTVSGNSTSPSVQYLKPSTYNRLGPGKEFPSQKTFRFSFVDKEGYLPKAATDPNRQPPDALKRSR